MDQKPLANEVVLITARDKTVLLYINTDTGFILPPDGWSLGCPFLYNTCISMQFS